MHTSKCIDRVVGLSSADLFLVARNLFTKSEKRPRKRGETVCRLSGPLYVGGSLWFSEITMMRARYFCRPPIARRKLLRRSFSSHYFCRSLCAINSLRSRFCFFVFDRFKLRFVFVQPCKIWSFFYHYIVLSRLNRFAFFFSKSYLSWTEKRGQKYLFKKISSANLERKKTRVFF